MTCSTEDRKKFGFQASESRRCKTHSRGGLPDSGAQRYPDRARHASSFGICGATGRLERQATLQPRRERSLSNTNARCSAKEAPTRRLGPPRSVGAQTTSRRITSRERDLSSDEHVRESLTSRAANSGALFCSPQSYPEAASIFVLVGFVGQLEPKLFLELGLSALCRSTRGVLRHPSALRCFLPKLRAGHRHILRQTG